MAKPKLLTSPAGIAEWPKLVKPDTKFDEAGVLSTKVKYSGADAQTQKDLIDAAMAQSLADAKADKENKGKIKQADPPYTENEDGTLSVMYKRKASGVSKAGESWTAAIALFDRFGKPLARDAKIGGGSTIKVSYSINPFYTKLVGAGVSLRLSAAQIINLVEFGGDASYFGFGAEAAEDAEEADVDAPEAADVEESPDF